MVNDSIDKIKKAEDDAKNCISDAQANSDRILRAAREKVQELINNAKKQALEESNAIIKNAEAEAAKEVDILNGKNEKEIEKIRTIAESNKSKAASFIIGRIIG